MDDNEKPLIKEFNFENKNKKKWISIGTIFITLTILLSIIILIIFIIIFKSKDDWKWSPQGDKIKTKWGKNLNPEKIWEEYPRPELEREKWMNLNGVWSYSITGKEDLKPEKLEGKILVPFPLESSLSGVMKYLTQDQVIWYEKEITIPKDWNDKKILLHFGGVDWKTKVYINNIKVGEHEGGYTSFYFDITKKLNFDEKNKISVKVFDPTNSSYQPRGKQVHHPSSIWYTSVSGIWQTVWLEPVKDHYIEKLIINNNFDNKQIKITFKINSDIPLPLNITIQYKNKTIVSSSNKSNQEITFKIKDSDFHPWYPSEPNLYDIQAYLYSENGNLYDSIKSYTTIRKIESQKDSLDHLRIYLNNKPLFNLGTLDQGYWPDGLYTPPSEEAMIYDIKKLKDLGFNTIRKHIKVEPHRYYYHCDKIGMLIWQDMPSGDLGDNKWEPDKLNGGTDRERNQDSKDNYYKEWKDIIEDLKFFQSIIVWIPFNEAWGQFDTEKVVEYTQTIDASRLINAASGGNHRICGNFLDLHHYPEPFYFLNSSELINVLGEYGGVALDIKGHTWKDNNWGYTNVYSKEELTYYYKNYTQILINLVDKGFSAAIYTQTTDVEGEINGLITYDREEVKIFENEIKTANKKLIESLNNL